MIEVFKNINRQICKIANMTLLPSALKNIKIVKPGAYFKIGQQ